MNEKSDKRDRNEADEVMREVLCLAFSAFIGLVVIISGLVAFQIITR